MRVNYSTMMMPSKPDDSKLVAPNLKQQPSAAKPFTGSDLENFNGILIGQACNALWTANSTNNEKQAQIQACLGALAGISPKDELEGMLAAQMVALHNAAMECFRRAMIKEQPSEGRQQNLNFANKLTRTFALHVQALDAHRGKGQQKVTVEHVHVHQGGQAIVGNVATGGSATNLEKQAHAHRAKPIAHSQEQALPSPCPPNRRAVPVPGDG